MKNTEVPLRTGIPSLSRKSLRSTGRGVERVPTSKRLASRKCFCSLPRPPGTSGRAGCYGPAPTGAGCRWRPRLPAGASRGRCRPPSSAGRSTSRTRGAPRDGRSTIGTRSREEARYPKRRARSSRSWRYARWPASPRSPRSRSWARCAARTRRCAGSSCLTPDPAARACMSSSWIARREAPAHRARALRGAAPRELGLAEFAADTDHDVGLRSEERERDA